MARCYIKVIAAVFAMAVSCLFLSVKGSVCINDTSESEGGSFYLVEKYVLQGTSKQSSNEAVCEKLIKLVKEKLMSYEEQITSYEEQITTLEAQITSYKEQLQSCQSTINDSKKLESCSVYRDCKHAYDDGFTTSGVYTIQPDDELPFQVYCDMETDSGGWTVFQRRKDGSVDFYRNWTNYEQGFGSLTREFWLGLTKIHRITAASSCAAGNELRIDLGDFEGNTRYANYGTFSVGDSSDLYRLIVSGYSGTATDSLRRQNGYPFSTKDRDHDIYDGNCAQRFRGAWWYDRCHESNLNGAYLGGRHSSYADGIEWRYWTGYYYSLKFTEMKTRCKEN